MAEANQSRRPVAPRAEDARTPIRRFLEHLELANNLTEKAESLQGVDRRAKPTGLREQRFFRNIDPTRSSWTAVTELHFDILQLQPQSDADLLALAGHASLIADQIEDLIPEDNPYGETLAKSVTKALIAVTAYLARKVEVIDTGCEDLNRSIRQDILVDAALHPDIAS